MPANSNPLYIEMISRLRAARVAGDVTQAQLARKLGKEQTFVSKVETCERRLDAIELALWCRALGISLKEVLPSVLVDVFDRGEGKQG